MPSLNFVSSYGPDNRLAIVIICLEIYSRISSHSSQNNLVLYSILTPLIYSYDVIY